MSTETKTTQKRTTSRGRKTTAPVEVTVPVEELPGEGPVEATVTEQSEEVLDGELIETTTSNVTSTRVVTLGATGEASTMFSERTVPWMRLGKITDGVSTAKEAARQANLDFDVVSAPTAFLWNGEWVTMGNRKTIVRADSGDPMSIVSAGYPILQYSDAFDFMDEINPQYVAAGSLKGGKQGFMVARVPESHELNLLDGDKHEMYMVLRTSHDLTRAVEVAMMPLRMKCMNQLTLRSFSAGVDHRWTIRHTSTMAEKLAEAKQSIMKYTQYIDAFKSLVERLAGIQISQDKARSILKQIIPDRPRTEEKINSIIALWQTGSTVGYTDNGWGFVNAVSDYYDWGRSGGSAESRFVASLQGQTHTAVNKVATRVLAA